MIAQKVIERFARIAEGQRFRTIINGAIFCVAVGYLVWRWTNTWEDWLAWTVGLTFGWYVFVPVLIQEQALNVINRTVRPTVWTFSFRLSKEYLERFLAAAGQNFRFDEPSLFGLRGCVVKIEAYSDRVRVHRWLP